MVHCCVVLLRCPLQRAVTLVVTPRLRRGPGERDGGSAPQRDGRRWWRLSGSHAELGRLDGAHWMLPSPRWQRGSGCGNATGSHGRASQSVPGSFRRGARASQPLRTSAQVWRVKLGEGWQNPTGCGLQALSSSFSQSLPSPLHCTLQDELFVCHLAPPSTFAGHRDGEGGFRLFVQGSIPDWMLACLSPGSSQHRRPLLPSGCWGHLCPSTLHSLAGAFREKEPQKGAERIETRR